MKKTITLILFIMCVLISLFLLSCQKQHQPQETYRETTDNIAETPPDTTKESAVPVPKPLKYDYRFADGKDIPSVSIVIDDFGQIGGDLLQGFAELDDNVTFAILPDLPNTQKTAKMANVYGHEVIIHIPMEALDRKQNPGKSFIRAGENEKDIKAALNNFIDQIPQAIGANNHMGSSATADYDVMITVLKTLNQKGLFFLDSKTNADSRVVNASKELNLRYVARDIFLDVPDVSASTLNTKLQQLQKYKGRIEPIIIISHCHNKAKLEAMRTFISQLKAMGIKLVPLSEAVGDFRKPV